MDSRSCWLGDWVGPVGQVVLEVLVNSSASLPAGQEAQGESEGAIPEVQVVGLLVDLEVGLLVDLEVGLLVDLEVGHLVDLEVGHLVDLEAVCPVGTREGYPEVQVVGSFQSG